MRSSGRKLRLHLRARPSKDAVEDAMVIVRTPYGEKAAQLVGTNAIWIAARLLRELAAEGKA
jgi:hypothetical protein